MNAASTCIVAATFVNALDRDATSSPRNVPFNSRALGSEGTGLRLASANEVGRVTIFLSGPP